MQDSLPDPHSETFVHDELSRRVGEHIGSAVREAWKTHGFIEPFVVAFPTSHLEADDGTIITHYVAMDLEGDRATWAKQMVDLVKKTSPYALFKVEQLDERVLGVFESPHGTKSWSYPIEKHGPDKVLGAPSTRVNSDYLGFLWRANRGRS